MSASKEMISDTMVVFENERFQPAFNKWGSSNKFLLPTDPRDYSSKHIEHVTEEHRDTFPDIRVPAGWHDADLSSDKKWKMDMAHCDRDGWSYAMDFKAFDIKNAHPTPAVLTFVRRRTWIRHIVKRRDEAKQDEHEKEEAVKKQAVVDFGLSYLKNVDSLRSQSITELIEWHEQMCEYCWYHCRKVDRILLLIKQVSGNSLNEMHVLRDFLKAKRQIDQQWSKSISQMKLFGSKTLAEKYKSVYDAKYTNRAGDNSKDKSSWWDIATQLDTDVTEANEKSQQMHENHRTSIMQDGDWNKLTHGLGPEQQASIVAIDSIEPFSPLPNGTNTGLVDLSIFGQSIEKLGALHYAASRAAIESPTLSGALNDLVALTNDYSHKSQIIHTTLASYRQAVTIAATSLENYMKQFIHQYPILSAEYVQNINAKINDMWIQRQQCIFKIHAMEHAQAIYSRASLAAKRSFLDLESERLNKLGQILSAVTKGQAQVWTSEGYAAPTIIAMASKVDVAQTIANLFPFTPLPYQRPTLSSASPTSSGAGVDGSEKTAVTDTKTDDDNLPKHNVKMYPGTLSSAELIIKMGKIQRQSSILGSWKEAYLVLTRDHWLHLFDADSLDKALGISNEEHTINKTMWSYDLGRFASNGSVSLRNVPLNAHTPLAAAKMISDTDFEIFISIPGVIYDSSFNAVLKAHSQRSAESWCQAINTPTNYLARRISVTPLVTINNYKAQEDAKQGDMRRNSLSKGRV